MDIVNQGLKKRYASEKRFRMLGLAAIIASMLFLGLLFVSIISNGYTAFWQTFIRLGGLFRPGDAAPGCFGDS
jgi:phosphate transport system permease protein